MTDEQKADLAVPTEDEDPLVNDLRVLEDARNLVVRLWALEEETQEADAQELAREAIAMVERLSKLADPRAVNERIFEALMAKCVELQWQNEQFQRVIEEDGEMIADMATAEETLSARLADAVQPAAGEGGLLPCPLCGSKFMMGQEPHDNHPIGGMFYLFHDYGPAGSDARNCCLDINRHFDTAEEAVSAWNTRAALSTSVPAGVEESNSAAAERTRIVAKIRDIATRFEPGSASQNNHRALARAIESGHAFAEGNPK